MPVVKVRTFNIGLMRLRIGGGTLFENPEMVEKRAPNMMQYLKHECRDSDVVCLQECYEDAHRRELKLHMDSHPHMACSFEKTFLNSGLVVMSKHPFVSVRRVPHESSCVYEKIFGDRAMLVTKIGLDGTIITVINAHLSAGAPVDTPIMNAMRRSQVADINRQVRASTTPTLVVGDFNCSPTVGSECYESMIGVGWKDAWAETNGGRDGITLDRDNALNRSKGGLLCTRSQRCDHIWYVGDEWRALGSSVFGDSPDGALSDHYGVAARLKLSVNKNKCRQTPSRPSSSLRNSKG